MAITTKVTLDQILGGIIWQATFLAVHEPYRAAALKLCGKVQRNIEQKLKPNKSVEAAAAKSKHR